MKKLFFLILVLLSNTFLYGQNGSISGSITDINGLPLIGANILVENTLLGTATDAKGRYRINNIPNGNYRVIVSVISYKKITSGIIEIKSKNEEVNFRLEPTSYQLDQLVISANKFSQDLDKIPTSTYLIDQKIFAEKNIRQIDDALRYVPGVTMTLDQISIRGSSGYSRGAGTRVLVTLDGIPIYSPDAGDIIWELVPVSEIGRVEIIKGASSSLYGSSAIGGVINVLSKEISSNPVTYLKFHGGIYSNPSHKEWEWTDRDLYFNSQTISHSRSIGKLSLSASVTRLEDYSYRQNDYQLRFGGYLNANYQFSQNTSLKLMSTGYTRDRETFNYWENIERALSPPTEDIGQVTNSDRTIFGLTLNHIFNNELSITFIPSAYLSYWKDNSTNRNNSDSKLYRSEIRANYNYSKSLKIISGIEGQFSKVSSRIFGKRESNGFGMYFQSDYNMIEHLDLSFGLRYDINKLENIEATQSLSPKIGATYKFNEQTTLRGALAKGYRAPTLAEAFTSTTTAGITVKPNLEIKSETSYTIEFGANHSFSENFNIDISVFNNEYYDMIEPGFDPSDGEVFFNNVTRARIQGSEVLINFTPISEINFKTGYTYLWARDIEKKKTLNYRPRHTIIIGASYTKSIYEFGLDARYLSRVDNIDNELVDLGVVPDGDERVEVIVIDANLGLNLFKYNIPLRFYFRANNLLNYNYVELIGNIAPLRNYSFNLELIF